MSNNIQFSDDVKELFSLLAYRYENHTPEDKDSFVEAYNYFYYNMLPKDSNRVIVPVEKLKYIFCNTIKDMKYVMYALTNLDKDDQYLNSHNIKDNDEWVNYIYKIAEKNIAKNPEQYKKFNSLEIQRGAENIHNTTMDMHKLMMHVLLYNSDVAINTLNELSKAMKIDINKILEVYFTMKCYSDYICIFDQCVIVLNKGFFLQDIK